MNKVCFIVRSFNQGGAERVVSRLSSELVSSTDLYILTFQSSEKSYNFSGKIIDLNIPATRNIVKKFHNLVKRIKQIRYYKKSYKFDTVISFTTLPNFINVLTKLKFQKTIISIRNVINDHGFFKRLAYKWLFSNTNLVIAVSEELKFDILKSYNNVKDVICIQNPYNFKEIQLLSKEKLLDFEISEKEHGKVKIVSMGRISKQKGFWHLIKSFYLVVQQFPDIHLYIIGRDESYGKCQQLIENLHLGDHVTLLGPQINPFKFLDICDIYINTSLHEGFPNALVEAMICGNAVVSSACKTGPREILLENPNFEIRQSEVVFADYGILVPTFTDIENWESFIDEDYSLLVDVITKLIKDKELLDEYKTKAQERAQMISSLDVVSKYLQVL
jgi:glycosyltransferase involved in cell wall biosynthesis